MKLLDKLSGSVKSRVEITISNKTLLRIILFIIGAILVYKFFFQIARPLSLVAISAFLAIALNPAVSWITHRLTSKKRARATGVAYLLVVSFLIGFVSLIIPPLVTQTQAFVSDVPQIVTDFRQQDSSAARFVRKYKLDQQIQNISSEFTKRAGNFPGPVLSTASKIGSIMISIITVLVLTFMMLVEGPKWMDRMWELYPTEYDKHHAQYLAKRMYRIVTRYVNGQIFVAFIAAMFSLTIMLIIGVPSAVALAGIVFLFGLIPLVGNTIAAAIVVIVSLFASFKLAVIMLIYFLVYQQIENVTLQPYIQSKNNELTPLIVFIAAITGASFGGIFGAFIAIPLTGCIKLLIDDWLSKHRGTETPDEQLVQ